jgi:hypothetical protein
VTKFAMQGGIDRNNNGIIETSYDENQNGKIDANEILPWWEDEAVLVYANVGKSSSGPRGLAIDAQNRLWVGLYSENRYVVLNAVDGSDTGINVPVKGGPYGAAIDGNGFLWSSGRSKNVIEKIDTNIKKKVAEFSVVGPYGITVDNIGNTWVASYETGNLVQINAKDEVVYHDAKGSYGRGVTVDKEGNIWVACSKNNKVRKYDSSGKHIKTIETPNGNHPIGVGVDNDGNIWSVNRYSHNTTKLTPEGKILGYYEVGIQPYTYSDMTGFAFRNVTKKHGSWTVVHDGDRNDYKWNQINWNELKSEGTNISVKVRATNDIYELENLEYIEIANGQLIENVSGRFIQIKVSLNTTNTESPILYDLSINEVEKFPIANAGEDIALMADETSEFTRVLLDGTNSYDPEGRNITYKWTWDGGEATTSQPEISLPTGTTKVTLVVNNGEFDSQPDHLNVTIVGLDSIKTSIATNKASYEMDEDVSISIVVENDSILTKELGTKLEIFDTNGNLVDTILAENYFTLEGNQSKVITATWNTAKLLAGEYIIKATWLNEGAGIEPNICSIKILANGHIENEIFVNKTEFYANDTVIITDKISNLSLNNIPKNLAIKTSIVKEDGNTVWSTNRTVEEILQSESEELECTWNTGQNAPGTYTVVTEVYLDNMLVSENRREFVIISSGTNSLHSITGGLEVSPNNIYPSNEVVFDYTLKNIGNDTLNDIIARIRVVDVEKESVIGTIQDTYTLGINESISNNKTWLHDVLEVGNYMVVYDVIMTNGQEMTLSSSYIRVEKPFDTSINKVVRPRVLVWAESEGNINLAKVSLDEMNVYYALVNNREDFISALRTDTYNTYALLDCKLPLTADQDYELAAEVAKGKGIIASRNANGDNLKNINIFGVDFVGNSMTESFNVELAEDEILSDISGEGKIQKVIVTDGTLLSSIQGKKGELPLIVTNKYEKGKSMLFTFDLGEYYENNIQAFQKSIRFVGPIDEYSKGITEIEIVVNSKDTVTAEIDLNIPSDVEVIWVYPEKEKWIFNTEVEGTVTLRAIVKSNSEGNKIIVDSYYMIPNKKVLIDSQEVVLN